MFLKQKHLININIYEKTNIKLFRNQKPKHLFKSKKRK